MCRWNLTRLAEALGFELDAVQAGAVLDEFTPTYEAFYLCAMRKKLGLVRKEEAEDSELVSDLLRLMHDTGTEAYGRKLSEGFRGMSGTSGILMLQPCHVTVT